MLTVLDLFLESDHGRPMTLGMVAEGLNVTEGTALSALERLEAMNLLVRLRAGSPTPVWKPRPGVDTSSLVRFRL